MRREVSTGGVGIDALAGGGELAPRRAMRCTLVSRRRCARRCSQPRTGSAQPRHAATAWSKRTWAFSASTTKSPRLGQLERRRSASVRVAGYGDEHPGRPGRQARRAGRRSGAGRWRWRCWRPPRPAGCCLERHRPGHGRGQEPVPEGQVDIAEGGYVTVPAIRLIESTARHVGQASGPLGILRSLV